MWGGGVEACGSPEVVRHNGAAREAVGGAWGSPTSEGPPGESQREWATPVRDLLWGVATVRRTEEGLSCGKGPP